jgi:D-beta-D-heptose 7-phosphate kinase/D-beta-D-heptose 1-phosphate adenosyltransferase
MIRLPDFSTSRVLVAGDVMLDSYWHGATARISPEAPVPVVQVQQQESRIGGAGNVAVNAASLGSQTSLVGLVGDDAAAVDLGELLRQHKIQAHLHSVPGGRTITKLRVISRHQQIIRLDFEDHFPAAEPASIAALFAQAAKRADAVILSDYAKGALREVQGLITKARQLGLPVIVDPKGADFERYRGATLITPNLAEFEAVAGHATSDDDLVCRAEELRTRFDLRALLITRSERGMTLVSHDAAPLHLPAQAREVFDVTGAGDTVAALIGASLAAGLGLEEAVRLSNVAASIVVGKLGTASVTSRELQAALYPQEGTGQVHCAGTEEEIVAFRAKARAQGLRVILTNGCFDILHPGHIEYLEQARALGDRLIVAVNDDESVRRLKGPARPVNPLSHRMRMLAALACVDWVLPFSEDTPARLIGNLLPDILVKGGDYRPDQIAGADHVVAAGGQVRVLGFVPGHSTTSLIDKIRGETQA